MRRVEIHLDRDVPPGWVGRRRVIVVREMPASVLLMQIETGRRLKLSRAMFEAAKPKTIPKDAPLIRKQIEDFHQVKWKPWTLANIIGAHARATLGYISANLVNHRNRFNFDPSQEH